MHPFSPIQAATEHKAEFHVWLSGGKDGGEGIVREFGINMYTLLYLKCITNKYLLYSTNHFSNNLSERLCEIALILEANN